MIEEIVRERIAAGENERTEFKRDFVSVVLPSVELPSVVAFASVSAVLPSVVAFANGAFEGWIIFFGVTDDAKNVGVSDSERLQQQLQQVCQQQCDPPLDARIETVKTNSGEIVVLRIQGDEAAKPYRQKEREVYWIRRGERNELVTTAEALAFVEQQYRVFSPALREIHVTGFRSLYDTELQLKPLNIIIGPNASGKSNFFKTLQFVRDMVGEGIGKGHQEIGRHFFWYGGSSETELGFTLDLTMEVPGQQGRFAPRYELGVKLTKDRLAIDKEYLMLRLHPVGPKVTFIDRQGGKVQRYAESINSNAENQTTDYFPVSGKLPLRTAALATYGREATFVPLQNIYRFVQGWRFLKVDPHAARNSVILESVEGEVPALQDNAGNLSAFLYALRNNETLDEIQERLCGAIQVPQSLAADFRPSVTGGPGKAEMIFYEKFFPDIPIPAESMSDGTLCLLATLAVLIGDPNATLICLEEPDQGLHPHLMMRLADVIRSVVDLKPEPGDEEFRRLQVIITTHSPDFMDCFDLRAEQDYLQVFIARRDAEGKTIFEPVTADEFEPWLKEYRLGDLARKNILDQGVF